MAQQLLKKQLERYQLNVTVTGNGNEAVAGDWPECDGCHGAVPHSLFSQNGSHMSLDTSVLRSLTIVSFGHPAADLPFLTEPDSDMPICDGIEACKRIRMLENKRKASILLPSKSLLPHAPPQVRRI